MLLIDNLPYRVYKANKEMNESKYDSVEYHYFRGQLDALYLLAVDAGVSEKVEEYIRERTEKE